MHYRGCVLVQIFNPDGLQTHGLLSCDLFELNGFLIENKLQISD